VLRECHILMARKNTVTEEQLREIVKNSLSFANFLRLLGRKQAGGNQRHVKERRKLLEIRKGNDMIE
jgi:hypothetical protein